MLGHSLGVLIDQGLQKWFPNCALWLLRVLHQTHGCCGVFPAARIFFMSPGHCHLGLHKAPPPPQHSQCHPLSGLLPAYFPIMFYLQQFLASCISVERVSWRYNVWKRLVFRRFALDIMVLEIIQTTVYLKTNHWPKYSDYILLREENPIQSVRLFHIPVYPCSLCNFHLLH